MKKTIAFLAASVLLTSCFSPFAASAADADVVVGERLAFAEDAGPIFVEDRLMLPLRAVSEALDATVYWFDDDKRVQIVLYDCLLSLQIGNNIMGRYSIKDGQATPVDNVSMDVPATISNDRTYVPLRSISEAFSADVSWDNNIRTALIVPKLREENFLSVAEAAEQPSGTLCAVRGVLGRDLDTGIFYIRSLTKNSQGEYDRVSFCTPVRTSISEDTNYGEYITAYWEEQFGTQNPSGIAVWFTGVTNEIEGQTYLVVNKTTTGIRSLGYYDTYMKSLGMSYEAFDEVIQ